MAFYPLASIEIRQCRWLARGQLRDIYQHPEFPEALVKVIRADRVDARGNVIAWSRRKLFTDRQFGIYATFAREFRETFRAARRLHSRPDVPLPFARPLGLAWTERGLGLIVEKVTAADGSLAPTAKTLIGEGLLTPAHREAIDRFFHFCMEFHLVFGDLNAGNLVLTQDGRFVCIDGIGEKAFLPIHELSRTLNARKLRRMQRRLHGYIDGKTRKLAARGVVAGNANGMAARKI